ncbi:hypothetical protein EII25_03490 [Erysipelotrichaceae bacterium OH741_COT-311]|nr:hypothetical protein EII25_03490 [Erysipelotrichaceae bacterium OH741_COT-311]
MELNEFKKLVMIFTIGIIAVVIVTLITPKKIEINDDYSYLYKLNSAKTEITIEQKALVEAKEPRSIRITSYWENDSTNSGSCTSSGLCTDDFQINEKGWYTYQDKLVLAGATYTCFYAETGACAKYNSLPDGFGIHSLYDEVTIFVDGVSYPGIILDSCGASFWREEVQRYDLFVSNEESKLDTRGHIEYE